MLWILSLIVTFILLLIFAVNKFYLQSDEKIVQTEVALFLRMLLIIRLYHIGKYAF